jgi:dTDP-4-amino-4,6-dideoxygalactose transaminase
MVEMIILNPPADTSHISQCETKLSEELNTTCLLTPSCTAALEMAALLLDIEPGDEIIMPSFTFPSTANAFALRDAVPIFCDIHPDTLNIDENQIERLITPQTKAIVPVHYAGVACEMDVIGDIAQVYDLVVIEDNAQGLFGKYKGKYLGTIGNLGCTSFHYTKNYSCGEGGALFINDETYLEKAYIIRDKGTNRQQFVDGLIDKYTWVSLGGSYSISDHLAEILLERLSNSNMQRKILFTRYMLDLWDWAAKNNVILPTVPDDCLPSYHIFFVVLPFVFARKKLQRILFEAGIESASHYLPLHLSPMNKRQSSCPVTEEVSQRLLRLPLHHKLSLSDQQLIIKKVLSYECN